MSGLGRLQKKSWSADKTSTQTVGGGGRFFLHPNFFYPHIFFTPKNQNQEMIQIACTLRYWLVVNDTARRGWPPRARDIMSWLSLALRVDGKGMLWKRWPKASSSALWRTRCPKMSSREWNALVQYFRGKINYQPNGITFFAKAVM